MNCELWQSLGNAIDAFDLEKCPACGATFRPLLRDTDPGVPS
jgi:hypothetical protein